MAPKQPDDEDDSGLIIPPESLQPETLRAIVEEYVTREGTDYGSATYTLDDKVAHVMRQLQRGEALLSFDSTSGSVGIIPARR